MDLSNPLATITPTLDAGVLQVVAATTAGCTAAEVHRRLGRGSDEGVRKVLARLVSQGIVLSETVARYPVYRFNREHLAAPHIEALTRLRGDLLAAMRGEVTEWPVAPIHVSVFGSFARGTADSDSDVDVLLVRPMDLDDDGIWLEQVDRLEGRITAWTGNDAQVIDLESATLESMARDGDPLVDSWRSDNVLIHGERLLHLLGSVR